MCEMDTYDTDELRQRHLDGDGHLLALVDSRPDQFVVTLRTQQVVHQPLFGVLRPAACRETGGGGGGGGLHQTEVHLPVHAKTVTTLACLAVACTIGKAAGLMSAVYEQ